MPRLEPTARPSESRILPGAVQRLRPVPEVGSILRLWDFADADRILMVSKDLDPGNRIRTGRPLR